MMTRDVVIDHAQQVGPPLMESSAPLTSSPPSELDSAEKSLPTEEERACSAESTPASKTSLAVARDDGHHNGREDTTSEKKDSANKNSSSSSSTSSTKPSILRNPIQRLRRRRYHDHQQRDGEENKVTTNEKDDNEEEVKTEPPTLDELGITTNGRPQISIVLAHNNEVVIEQLRINKLKAKNDTNDNEHSQSVVGDEDDEDFYSPLKLKSSTLAASSSSSQNAKQQQSSKRKGIIKNTTSLPTTRRSYSSSSQHPRHMSIRRVSFDETSIQQYQWESRQRSRRNLLDTVRLAMPVILPYIIAIFILIVSSLIPPANETHYIIHHRTHNAPTTTPSSIPMSNCKSPTSISTTIPTTNLVVTTTEKNKQKSYLEKRRPFGGLFHFLVNNPSTKEEEDGLDKQPQDERLVMMNTNKQKQNILREVSSVISSSSTESLYQLATSTTITSTRKKV